MDQCNAQMAELVDALVSNTNDLPLGYAQHIARSEGIEPSPLVLETNWLP